MANKRNYKIDTKNKKRKRKRKRRINKKKLVLLIIVLALFIIGTFKLTQSAISGIKNISSSKKQTSVVESSNDKIENVNTQVNKNINKKYYF